MTEALTDSTEGWVDSLHTWLAETQFGADLGEFGWMSVVILGTLTVAITVHWIVRIVVLAIVRKVVKHTPTKWDDYLVERRFFTRISHLAPALVIFLCSALFTPPFFDWSWQTAVQRIAGAYLVIIGVMTCNAALSATGNIYETLKLSRKNPIKGFVQGAKLIVWLVGVILFVAVITGKNPAGIVAGIGAIAAVMMLVFKDSILGLVASIQIFVNDLVNVGDWIEMPKYGADGDVIDITLTTIKVQNWDMTITTIPSYAVIADSFKNWRGMSESGGRRIKRSVMLDINSIKFCTDEMLDQFEQFEFLGDYIGGKRREIAEYNEKYGINTSKRVNGRNLTNIGTFRAYLLEYLRSLPKVHPGMTLLVRQLAPTDKGIPIEMYLFTSDTAWVAYEDMQADIIDHILAIIPEFDLRVFQGPGGSDIRDAVAKTM